MWAYIDTRAICFLLKLKDVRYVIFFSDKHPLTTMQDGLGSEISFSQLTPYKGILIVTIINRKKIFLKDQIFFSS